MSTSISTERLLWLAEHRGKKHPWIKSLLYQYASSVGLERNYRIPDTVVFHSPNAVGRSASFSEDDQTSQDVIVRQHGIKQHPWQSSLHKVKAHLQNVEVDIARQHDW